MGMANLQRMAQQMQQEMLRVQGELDTITVDGSAGGGVVSATVTGKQELVSVTIDPARNFAYVLADTQASFHGFNVNFPLFLVRIDLAGAVKGQPWAPTIQAIQMP